MPDKYKIYRIQSDKIKPNKLQPRKYFSEKDIAELTESIKENGIIQPITVRKNGEGFYEIIAGERRFRAAQLAGYKTIPCIISACDEREASVLSVIENIQRQNLNFFEEAAGLERIIELCGLSQEEAAQKIGKSQSSVANKLRLLKFTEEEKRLILSGNLTERHARALLKITDREKRLECIKEIIKRKYNVSQTEKYVSGTHKKIKSKGVIKDIRIFINTVDKAVQIMKESGIKVQAQKTEDENELSFVIKIPKKRVS